MRKMVLPEIEIKKVQKPGAGIPSFSSSFKPCATSTPSMKRNGKENLMIGSSPITAFPRSERNQIPNGHAFTPLKKVLPIGTTLTKVNRAVKQDPPLKASNSELNQLRNQSRVKQDLKSPVFRSFYRAHDDLDIAGSSDEDSEPKRPQAKKKVEPPQAKTSARSKPAQVKAEAAKNQPPKKTSATTRKTGLERKPVTRSKQTKAQEEKVVGLDEVGPKPEARKIASARKNNEKATNNNVYSLEGVGRRSSSAGVGFSGTAALDVAGRFETTPDEKVLAWLKSAPPPSSRGLLPSEDESEDLFTLQTKKKVDRNDLFTTVEEDSVVFVPIPTPTKKSSAKGTKRKVAEKENYLNGDGSKPPATRTKKTKKTPAKKKERESLKKVEVQKELKSIVDGILREEEMLTAPEQEPRSVHDSVQETIDMVARGLNGGSASLATQTINCGTLEASHKNASKQLPRGSSFTTLGPSGVSAFVSGFPNNSGDNGVLELNHKSFAGHNSKSDFDFSGSLPKEIFQFSPDNLQTWRDLKAHTGIFYTRMVKIEDQISSGYLKIEPEKTLDKSSSCHQCYTLLKGKVELHRNGSRQEVKAGASLFIPSGDHYVISNTWNEDAILQYFKIPDLLAKD